MGATPVNTRNPRKQVVFWLLGVVIVSIIAWVWFNPHARHAVQMLFAMREIDRIRAYVQALGPWGPIAMMGLMVAHSVSFVPSELIMVSDVFLFGPVWGIAYAWAGAMLGAYLSFYLARWIGRPIVHRFVPAKMLERFDAFFERRGVLGVFYLRLIPLVSFNALNYACGLTEMSFWEFTWSTGLGILPSGILFGLLYHSVTDQKFAFIGLTVVGIVLLLVLIIKAKMKRFTE